MRLNSDLTPQQLWTIAADSEHRDRDVLDELVSHPNSYRALSDWALAGLAVEDPRSLDVPPQPDAVEPVQKRKRRFPGLKAKKRGGGTQYGGAAPTSFSPAATGSGVMGPGRVEPAARQAAHVGPGPSEATSHTPYGSAPSRKTANRQATVVNSDPQTVPIDVQSEYRRRQEHRSRTAEPPRSLSQNSDSLANFSHLPSPEIPQSSANHTAHVGRAPFSTDSTTFQGGSSVPPRSGISDWVSAGEQLSQSVRSPEPAEPQKKVDPHDMRSLPATWNSSPPPGTPLTPTAPRNHSQPTNLPVENGHKQTGWAAKPAPYGVVAALAALQVLTVLALLLVVVWGH